MQEIKIYVAASDAAGVIRDYANARNVSAPSLVKGIETCLKLRLFTENNNLSPYPIEQLASVASWEWVMDRDFNSETNYILSFILFLKGFTDTCLFFHLLSHLLHLLSSFIKLFSNILLLSVFLLQLCC